MKTGIGLALAAAIFTSSVATASAQFGFGNIPSGSYQQSCVNAYMRGNTLIASCTNNNGQRVTSSLDVSRCRGADIGNVNGTLSCNGNGYGGYRGYGRRDRNNDRDNDNDDRFGNRNFGNQLPSGSYQQSCTNARITGNVLHATCTNSQGFGVRSSLNLNQCGRRADIGNIDGRLRCVRNF